MCVYDMFPASITLFSQNIYQRAKPQTSLGTTCSRGIKVWGTRYQCCFYSTSCVRAMILADLTLLHLKSRIKGQSFELDECDVMCYQRIKKSDKEMTSFYFVTQLLGYARQFNQAQPVITYIEERTMSTRHKSSATRATH